MNELSGRGGSSLMHTKVVQISRFMRGENFCSVSLNSFDELWSPYEINLVHLRIFLEKIIFISREIGKSESYGPLKERQRTALTTENKFMFVDA